MLEYIVDCSSVWHGLRINDISFSKINDALLLESHDFSTVFEKRTYFSNFFSTSV